jgi:serine/threonine-protein kinase SRPK3
MIIELTGQTFPDKMLKRANLRKEYFDDTGMSAIVHFGLISKRTLHWHCTGNLLRIPELIPVSLEAAMGSYKIPNLSEDEIHLAADFIRACLKFDYEERATAEDLQKHKFLANAFEC